MSAKAGDEEAPGSASESRTTSSINDFDQRPDWRTEPEIGENRQRQLHDRLDVIPDIERGIYAFSGMQLNRADIEWLLFEHEGRRGPVLWSDPMQRDRDGLDLRGANLAGVNLSHLPLARTIGGLRPHEYVPISGNHLGYGSVAAIDLRKANLYRAHLEGSTLTWVHLDDASLELAHLEAANLEDAYLAGTSLRRAELQGASLRFALLDARTNLNYAIIATENAGCIRVGDTTWNNVNLSMIDWASVNMLGDERRAMDSRAAGIDEQVTVHRTAVRANRQLAVALQAQGSNEEASYFAYRANKLQSSVFFRQKKYFRYAFNLILDWLAGFGYRPMRTLTAYCSTIVVFTVLYPALSLFTLPAPLPWGDAFILSITSFHGRGFFPQEVILNHSLARLAAVEAVLGLIVEVGLIATFTQRFLGR